MIREHETRSGRASSAWLAFLVLGTLLGHPPDTLAENLIQDGSSFEAGLDGCALGLLGGRLDGECASVVLEPDATTAAHGKYSLKFVRPETHDNRYALCYKPVALRPGRAYTLSAYLKGQEEGAMVGLILGGFPSREQRQPGVGAKPKQEMIRLTRQWQRYELHIPSLPPSAPADGAADLSLYYVAVSPGPRGSTFWIDAVQLDEGDKATPFATDKPLELSVTTQTPGNVFCPGDTVTPNVQLYLAKAPGAVQVTCRAVDVLGQVLTASRKTVHVPKDGHATAALDSIPARQRAWMMLEVTATADGREEKEYLSVAVVEKTPPPLADQPCQFGFDLNAITSPDDLGAQARWQPSNMHMNLDRVLRLASQSGVSWIRMADIVRWQRGRSCETSPGKFVFYDDVVKAVKGYGLAMMATLANANAREDFCPEWADSGRKSRLAPLPTQEAWRRYIRAMVDHYKQDIKHWEIINEPNTAILAEDYLPLLQAAYEEAKAADPQCKVVGICATSDFFGGEYDPYGYVRRVAEGGGLKSLDIVSAHTLCKGRPWQSRSREALSWEYIASLLDVMRQYASGKTFPIWNTEGVKYAAWTDRPNIRHATAEYATRRMNRNTVVSQRLAAAYVVRDSVIEFCSGANVLFLWEFRNAHVNANIAFVGALGLMDWFGFDGTPQAKFAAINALTEKLHGARPVEHFGLSPRVRCAVFQSPTQVFALLWREDQDETDSRTYLLPVEGSLEVQDLFGRPFAAESKAGRTQVPVSEVPVYLIAPPDTDARTLVGLIRAAAKQVDFSRDTPLENRMIRR